MSRFSGKCDLADHISFMKHRTKDGSDKKEDLEKAHVLYSDEMECFKIFKERTGGILHQHKILKITPWNLEEAEKLTKGEFKAIKHTKVVDDKRTKSGKREETYYTYQYWGKEYKSLSEINKKRVYITIDIKFDTLLDLIPYYPYIVSMSCSNNGKETVYISQDSFVDEERDEHLENGWYSDYWQHYKKDLQDHYREVVLRYFNPEGRENVEEITFEPVIENDITKYIGYVSKPVDENFSVEWHWSDGITKSHWTSPKVLDYKAGKIEMSQSDYEHFLGNTMNVYYVEAKEYERYLS